MFSEQEVQPIRAFASGRMSFVIQRFRISKLPTSMIRITKRCLGVIREQPSVANLILPPHLKDM